MVLYNTFRNAELQKNRGRDHPLYQNCIEQSAFGAETHTLRTIWLSTSGVYILNEIYKLPSLTIDLL